MPVVRMFLKTTLKNGHLRYARTIGDSWGVPSFATLKDQDDDKNKTTGKHHPKVKERIQRLIGRDHI